MSANCSSSAPAWAAFPRRMSHRRPQRLVCRLALAVRGWLDRLAGGPGLRRGRRDPDTLRYGEALDFWRVVGFEQDRCLSLRAEMRLPGEALLDFRIAANGDGQCVAPDRLVPTPRSPRFDLLVRRAPFHRLMFPGMLAGIQRDARSDRKLLIRA